MIVITGAAGFIGSNLLAGLNERGHTDIAVCDRLGHDLRWHNLRKRLFREWVFPEELAAFLDKRGDVDAVLHLGANSSTAASDGDEMVRSNLQFSLRLLDWCALNAVPLVYASSAATYGDGANGFADGLDFGQLRKLRPRNLYGWTKHQFDLVVAERAARGLKLPPRCVGLKFFNVFGQNEYHKGDMMSVVARNFEIARDGGVVELFRSHRDDCADGDQRRDFIYIDDVVDVLLWCLDRGPDRGLFNVGTGQATSFRELVEALFAAFGRPPGIRYVPMPERLRAGYQYFTRAPIEGLRQAGYTRPFTPVPEAIAKYVRYLGSEDRYR